MAASLDSAGISIPSVSLARGDKAGSVLRGLYNGTNLRRGGEALTWSYCAMNFRTVMQYARDICRATHTGQPPRTITRSRVFVRASLVSLLRRIHHVGGGGGGGWGSVTHTRECGRRLLCGGL